MFGSPVAGTPLMQNDPLLALDLPLKVLVWEDDGKTRLDYDPPVELAAGVEAVLSDLDLT